MRFNRGVSSAELLITANYSAWWLLAYSDLCRYATKCTVPAILILKVYLDKPLNIVSSQFGGDLIEICHALGYLGQRIVPIIFVLDREDGLNLLAF